MPSALTRLLDRYRGHAPTEREKGEYFENLIGDFLLNDPVQCQQYDRVWTYTEWANNQGLDGQDAGIDLVASMKEAPGFCAIQCKLYAEDRTIQKSDIDKFFSASSKDCFSRRLFVDTTLNELSKNVQKTIDGQNIETLRLGLQDLEQSPIDWNQYSTSRKVHLNDKKEILSHQKRAVEEVRKGLQNADRGKMIMACGTGKTFTSLKIAEDITGIGKSVLYMVPSLALMSQTIREWSTDTETDLRCFAVCSDQQIGKQGDDTFELQKHDLAYPATTNAEKLLERIRNYGGDERMTVVFATYQSIHVVQQAQEQGLPEFDLIICDEAHRTTGVTLSDENESNFVRVHDQNNIQGKKRLYMTATPKIYGDAAKTKAGEYAAELVSMDDPAIFGDVLYGISFSEAVEQGLLTDYRVIVLAIDEVIVSRATQNRLSDENTQLRLDDATKIIGCYRALTKVELEGEPADKQPMKRAVAFCNRIQSSKLVTEEFTRLVEEYQQSEEYRQSGLTGRSDQQLICQLDHVDGTMGAKKRNSKLDWLKQDSGNNNCRILSNARCLVEGVDVPNLDAVLFMHPRKSQIEVVQAVGRVMRLAAGKKMGYVILPVGIPAGIEPEQALNNNEKYRVIWQVLNALRSHDERLDARINKAGLGGDISDYIEVVAIQQDLGRQRPGSESEIDVGGKTAGDPDGESPIPSPGQTSLGLDEFTKAVMAKIVKRCGTRDYWEDWAKDVADIAQRHITRIETTILEQNETAKQAFDEFLKEIRDDLNDSITKDDAIEMLAQHIITKPIFKALFAGYDFIAQNPASQAMQKIVNVLQEHQLDNESQSLEKFYASVQRRVQGLDTAEQKQHIITELYDKFFKTAFPRMTEKLGIVYTPVEVVDFIIHSVNDALRQEFGKTLGSPGIHILDPFTGTGTFITRLLQSGLIKPDELARKYQHEIHANEIILLAYYIAAINIEQTYHELCSPADRGGYQPFNGICLTDTFQLYEKDDMISRFFVDNSQRRMKQKQLNIRVIVGNPPYSAGQRSANDDNANVRYQKLDGRIRNTYAQYSRARLLSKLYDSYIRAIRWGSDRLGDSGIMAYVSNASWLSGNSMDGLRKCLAEEYSSLYILNLRGNQRTRGELSRQEGGKIFGGGSRAPIAITLFIKNPRSERHGQIYYHDIGDYLDRQQKLGIIQSFKSISGIKGKQGWLQITPDKHHDWLDQSDDSFGQFFPLGDKEDKKVQPVFNNYSLGIVTSRDPWVYNASQCGVSNNMQHMINEYNWQLANGGIIYDSNKIKWSDTLERHYGKNKTGSYSGDAVVRSMYRPFEKRWLYYNRMFNHRVYQMPQIFPIGQPDLRNKVICVSGIGAKSDFSLLMTDHIPNLDIIEKSQCFPLHLYDEHSGQGSLENISAHSSREFSHDKKNGRGLKERDKNYQRRDGISDASLKYFQDAYPRRDLSKEDLFYYIYGLLHSDDYRKRYANNLTKQLPRIPAVKKYDDFIAFTDAGRKLADLHINYETVEPYPVNYKEGGLLEYDLTGTDYRVEKMKFGGRAGNYDKSTLIYNHKITLTDIPLEAYDYSISGKAALEWVMDRWRVKTDKDSGILNDPNIYAQETAKDAAYPIQLFRRVIRVSLETMKIVRSLPELDID